MSRVFFYNERRWSLVTAVGSSVNVTFYCSSVFGNLEKTDDVIRRRVLYSELRVKILNIV